MENLDALLGTDEILSRVTEFELTRGGRNGQLIISVHEVLNGPNKNKFYAVPNDLIHFANEQYTGRGGSVEDALKDCLAKIKGIATGEIIDSPEIEKGP